MNFLLLSLALSGSQYVNDRYGGPASTSLSTAADGVTEALAITIDPAASFTPGTTKWLNQADVTGSIDSFADLVAVLPKNINAAVTVTVLGGTFASASLSGYGGSGSITINGTLAVQSLGGSMTGTAGGSSTTAILHNAGTAWTSSALLGYFAEITDTAVQYYRPIVSNTTTLATVQTLSQLSSGDTFRIVAPSTIITALTVSYNQIPVTLNYVTATTSTLTANKYFKGTVGIYTTLTSTRNSYIDLTTATLNGAVAFTDDDVVNVEWTYGGGSASVAATGVARLKGEYYSRFKTGSSAVTLTRVGMVTWGYLARDCTFTPLTLVDTVYVVGGEGLKGTSNTGAVGVALSGHTMLRYSTRPTLVGTADASTNSTTHTWATIEATSTLQYGSVKYITSLGVTYSAL